MNRLRSSAHGPATLSSRASPGACGSNRSPPSGSSGSPYSSGGSSASNNASTASRNDCDVVDGQRSICSFSDFGNANGHRYPRSVSSRRSSTKSRSRWRWNDRLEIPARLRRPASERGSDADTSVETRVWAAAGDPVHYPLTGIATGMFDLDSLDRLTNRGSIKNG